MALEHKLKKINLALALFIILSPLIAHYEYIFPYIYLKNIVFRFSVILGIFFMIWYSLYKDKISIRRYLVFLAFLAFLVVQILATVLGVNMINSALGNFERMDGLLNLISLALYFLLLINTFKSTKDWLWIFRASIITALLVIAYEVFGRWGWIGDIPIPHKSGTIGSTLYFGSYLMFNVFFALLAYYIDRHKSWKIFYLLSIILEVVFIFINASRSSMIGLVAGFGILMIFMFFRVNKKFKILFVSLVIIFLSLVGLVIAQRNSAWVQNIYFLERLTNISRDDFSTNNRLLTWQVAIKAFYDKPILGYGPENAMYAVNKHYNPEVSEQWFDRAHNFVLDHLLNAGILGLLSFLAIFVLAFRASWHYLKKHYFLAATLMATLVAYLISNLFTFDSLVTWLPLVLVLAFIDFLAIQDKEAKQIELSLWMRKSKKIILVIILILFSTYAYFMIIRPTQANRLGIRAAMYSQIDVAKSVEKFQQAFDYNTYGNGEIARALADMAKLKIASEDVTVADKEKIVLELEREILFILERDPINVRMRMILADIYLDMAEFDSSYIDKAIKIIEPGFIDSPERLELHSIMASAYLIKNDLGKALDYLEQSMAIYDGREQDYLNMFYLLYKHNDIEKMDSYVKKYLARFDDISVENYNIISRYYINMLAGQKLLDTGICQRLIELEPEVIGHRTVLLDAYNSAGLQTEALEYIASTSAINPEWPDKLQKYWDLIQD